VTFESDLNVLVAARHPVIWVVTHEEDRALRTAQSVAAHPRGRPASSDNPAKQVYLWSVSRGLVDATREDDEKVKDAELTDPVDMLKHITTAARADRDHQERAIYVLRDIHKFLGEGSVTYRFLRDAASAVKTSYLTILVTSPVSALPLELQKVVTLVDMPLPTLEELGERLDDYVVKPFKLKLVNGEREKVLKAGLGLTEDEFEAACCESLARTPTHIVDPRVVVKSKEQILRKSNVEFFEPQDDLANVGGLDALKTWITQRSLAFTEKAAAFGLRPPKGLFLTGPPGTGKSLTAKAAASTLGMPLLKIEAASIFGKYVGESEGNLQRILKTADAVAPCVLWVDEIEKTTAGARAGSDNDSGTTSRVFGALLQWMEEHRSAVFVIATANDPMSVRPELMARFNAVFFVDMPTLEARAEILSIHMRKTGRTVTPADMMEVAEASPGFSGRELEQCIMEALNNAYSETQGASDVTTAHLLAAVRNVRPLSVSRHDEIENMRKWAKENAKPAATPPAVQPGHKLLRAVEAA
jgi:ATP-dependent 26S proteasome regulatory subunit